MPYRPLLTLVLLTLLAAPLTPGCDDRDKPAKPPPPTTNTWTDSAGRPVP